MIFKWALKFRDGNVVTQDGGIPFKDVVKDNVVSIFLFSESRRYGFNLETGDVLLNENSLSDYHCFLGVHPDIEHSFTKLLKDESHQLRNVRPIYFKRVTVALNMDLTPKGEPDVVYAIGYQATVNLIKLSKGDRQYHLEPHNVKHILYVYDNGCVLT